MTINSMLLYEPDIVKQTWIIPISEEIVAELRANGAYHHDLLN